MIATPVEAGCLATLDALPPAGREDSLRPSVSDEVLAGLGDELEALAATDLAAAERVVAWLVPLTDDLGAPPSRVRIRRAAAHTLTYAGRPDEALAACEEAHRIAAVGDDPVEAARATLASVHPLAMLGRFDEAIASSNAARTALAELGRADLAARADLNLGAIYSMLDRIPEAVAAFDRARPSLVTEPSLLAQLESNAGVALIGVGRFDEAADALGRATAAFEQSGQSLSAAVARGNLAHLLVRRGRLAEGVALFERVDRELAAAAAAPAQRARLLAEQAAAFGAVGLVSESAELAARAIPELDAAGMALDAAIAHLTLASAQAGLGDVAVASRSATEASRRLSAIGNEAGAARADIILARLLLPSDAAGAQVAVARRAAARDGRPLDELEATLVSADISLARDELARAATLIKAADLGARRIGYLPGRAEALHLTGRIRRATGAAALWPLRGALAAAERLRSSFGAVAFQGAVQMRFLDPYLDLIREAVARDRPAEAFWVAERCKQRRLAESLGPSFALAGDSDDDGRAVDRVRHALEEQLRWRYSEIAQASLTGEGVDANDINAIDTLERQLAILERRDEADHLAETPSRTWPTPVDQRLELPAGAVGLSYMVLADVIIAFVASPDGGSIRSVVTPFGPGELDRRLAAVRFQITRALGQPERSADPRLIAAFDRASAALYDLILRPVEPFIAGVSRLVISAHGDLHGVPYAALWNGAVYAGDRWTMSLLPNLTLANHLANLAPRPGAPLLVGASDDHAPAIAAEIEAIRRALPGATTLVGDDATVGRVSDGIAAAGDVHIASHGHFSTAAPRSAGLRMSDGWLTAGAIQRLPLRGAHVTLSGCDTGSAARSALDDAIGLPASLHAAGASSMLVSRWPAHDDASTRLMTTWYRERAAGAAPALALQSAQSETRRHSPHPALWSTFYVGGIE